MTENEMTLRARELRRNMTPAERLLWKHLRSSRMGLSFRRQEPIGRYIVDFVCYPARLVLEVDGGQHRNNPNDAVRDAWLESQGFRVMRFWNSEVLGNPDGVLERIRILLADSSPSAPS